MRRLEPQRAAASAKGGRIMQRWMFVLFERVFGRQLTRLLALAGGEDD